MDVSKVKALQVDLPMLVAELTDHVIETTDEDVEVVHLTYNFPGYKYACIISMEKDTFTSSKDIHNDIAGVLSGRMHDLMIKGIGKENG